MTLPAEIAIVGFGGPTPSKLIVMATSFGPLIVHRNCERDGGYAISHGVTGYRIALHPCEETAMRIAAELAEDPAWGFEDMAGFGAVKAHLSRRRREVLAQYGVKA